MRKLIVIAMLVTFSLAGCNQVDKLAAEEEKKEVEKNQTIEDAKARVQETVDEEQERVDEVNAAMEE